METHLGEGGYSGNNVLTKTPEICEGNSPTLTLDGLPAGLDKKIIFLCGKRRKDDKFRGMSQGRSPRDILRNLSTFLSFPHKNVILFRFTGTRICILSPHYRERICILSLSYREKNGFFILFPVTQGKNTNSFPVMRGKNTNSLLIYLFIRNGQFLVNLKRISFLSLISNANLIASANLPALISSSCNLSCVHICFFFSLLPTQLI